MGVWCAERGGWASCLALIPHTFSPCRKYAEFKGQVVKAVWYMSKAFHCLVWCDCPLACTFCKESNNVVVLNFFHHLWEFLLLFHDEKTSCQVLRHRWASLCQFTSSILTLPEGAGCFLWHLLLLLGQFCWSTSTWNTPNQHVELRALIAPYAWLLTLWNPVPVAHLSHCSVFNRVEHQCKCFIYALGQDYTSA
jgi:hypothetical protein